MELKPRNPNFERDVRGSFAKQSMMETLGARILSVVPGQVEIAAPVLPGSLQQAGFGHAALTFAIGDSAAGYSALSLMAPDEEVLTAEMKINLLAPAAGDRLVARGRVIRPGRRLFVVGASVFAETADRSVEIALLQGTMVPVPAP